MNPDNCELACGLVSRSYISQGQQALSKRERLVKALLSTRKMPERGWDEATIEQFVADLASMDSNNFLDNVGVGEREARVACPLVARRHYRLAHGIGRSGDLVAEQPKAAGSSLLAKITNCLAAHALSLAGLQDLGPVTVMPLSTGMALTLTLLGLREARPGARYVVWSRIDQKTCLKCIAAAGYIPVVVELLQRGDELTTDVQAIAAKVQELGPESVACVMTTTSCFAPRVPDDVVAVAKLCASSGVPHIINNAYGVQSAAICRAITSAWRKGRVDAIVQSTDKNFMVPVGGAVVAASKQLPDLVHAVNKLYPGRAAVNAHLDLLMTLLSWGVQGWTQELERREELYAYLHASLSEAASLIGERVLSTPNNPISIALTLDGLAAPPQPAPTPPQAPLHTSTPPPASTSTMPSTSPTPCGPSSAAAAAGEGQESASAPSAPSAPSTSAASPQTAQQQPSPSAAADSREAPSAPASSEQAAGGKGPSSSVAACVPACAAPAGSASVTAAAASASAAAAAAAAAAAGAVPATADAANGRGAPSGTAGSGQEPTFLGSMLWARCISGTRVVGKGKKQNVAGLDFVGYGSHCNAYPHVYLTAAAAIGTTAAEADEFAGRLVKAYREMQAKGRQQGRA